MLTPSIVKVPGSSGSTFRLPTPANDLLRRASVAGSSNAVSTTCAPPHPEQLSEGVSSLAVDGTEKRRQQVEARTGCRETDREPPDRDSASFVLSLLLFLGRSALEPRCVLSETVHFLPKTSPTDGFPASVSYDRPAAGPVAEDFRNPEARTAVRVTNHHLNPALIRRTRDLRAVPAIV